MPTSFEQFVLSDLSLRLVILLIVILVERYFYLPQSYHPGTLLRYFAQSLATKVNKRSRHQQAIAGIISTVITLSLIVGACAAILLFAMLPWCFEALFLWLMLDSSRLIKATGSIKHSLAHNKKSLAREQLNLLCIRDTAKLSPMGIIKAAIEGLIQRVTKNYFNIIIYYMVLGFYAALIVAIINSLAHYWNPKRQSFRYFGQFCSNLAGVLNLPVQLLVTLIIGLLYGIKHLTLSRNSWHRYGSGALLATTANVLKRELGGAIMYDAIKIRRVKVGTSIPPQLDDIKHVAYIVNQLRLSFVAIITLSLLTSLTLSNL